MLLAGSLPPRTDARTWRRLAAFLGERGVAWLADVDASALGDLVANLPRRWMPVLAKPNQEELQALAGRVLGGPADVANAAQDLLCGRGVRHVLVSLGAEGVVAIGPEGRWHVPALPAPAGIHSTSGAGDTLLAGTLAAWDGADGAGWGEAVRFGMACAAWRLQGPASALPPWPVLREQADRLTPHPV